MADGRYVLSVPGIHCAACVHTIGAYLKSNSGICIVEGDTKTKQIKVSYQSTPVTQDEIREMIGAIGCKVGGE